MKKFTALFLGLSLLLVLPTYAQTSNSKDSDHVRGEMLVQTTANGSMRELLKRAPQEFNLKFIKELSHPMRVSLLKYDEENNGWAKMQNWLYAQPEVSLVDLNVYVDLRSTTPGDPNFTQQWHHVNTGQTGGTPDADIDSDLAWDITTGGTSATNDDIVVCMIESGNLDHIDLAPNRWVNTDEVPNNGIDDDNNGYVDDYNGWNPLSNNDNYGTGAHGTNCLGMIGAKGDNGTLVTGANWDVKLMVVGGYSVSTQADVIEAYTYPLIMRRRWNASNGTEGAFVVATSASWGLDNTQASTRPIWCQFYDTLGYAGILNVGATTNNNANVDNVGDVPTQCTSPYMIGVGRTDHEDNWEGGYGTTSVDFGAPGVSVVTTAGSNGTTSTTGTSFSCPLTAGVIGLAYSIPCADFMTIVKNDPRAGADSVLNALLNGVDVKANLASRYVTSGRLNARNTLDLLMANSCSGDLCLSPSGISASVTSDNDASISFNPYGDATSATLFWREVGAPTWTEVTNATSPVALTGLTECTNYEFYMTSTCDTETSGNSATQEFTTTGCGQCIEGAYCGSEATNPADEWIEEFTISTYTNTSGQDNGYGDFTASSSIDLNKNQPYSFTVTPGWDGTLYNEQTRIWIDLNQDDVFDANEMVFDQGTADQNVVNGQITIPLAATSGNTRMRIQMAYVGNGQNTLPEICDDFQWGEVEDYCVNIISPQNCGITATANSSDVTCFGDTDGSMSVDNIAGGTPGYTYTWTDNLGSNNSVANVGAGSYAVTISDAAGCDTTIFYTISQPDEIVVTSSVTNPDCNGASTGAIDITNVVGGVPGYSYSWSNSLGTNEDVNSLSAGNYSVVITDNANCEITENFSVVDPQAHNANFNVNENGFTVNLTNTSIGNGTYSWDFGDANTSTSQNPSHTYADEGNYEICLTLTTSCGTFEHCENITIVTQGLNEVKADQIEVYPNPAKDVVNFKITNGKVTQLEIIDVIGKVVYTQTINQETTSVQVSDFAEGQYMYKLKGADGSVLMINRLVITK